MGAVPMAKKKAKRTALGPCKMFLLCRNKAVTTRPHPILVSVPTCKRCNDKMDHIANMR